MKQLKGCVQTKEGRKDEWRRERGRKEGKKEKRKERKVDRKIVNFKQI
jgi:hypothetical protein